MNTKTQLENALTDAMRAKDDLRRRTLRMALSAIRLAEIEKRVALDDAAVLSIVQKEIKSRQETIVDAKRAGRADLEAEARDEIGVLEAYLPQAMPPQELEDLVRAAIAESGAASQRDMGKVMKVLMPRLQGHATGDQVNQIVRKLLPPI